MACIDHEIRKNKVATVIPKYIKSVEILQTHNILTCYDCEGIKFALKSILGIKSYVYSQLMNAYKLYTKV